MHADNVMTTFDGKAFFFFSQKKCWAKGDLIRFGKKLLLGRARTPETSESVFGAIFSWSRYRGLGPVSLFPLAVTVSRVSCRPCLQFSLFVKLFHIKITFNKENVLETASVMHRDFVGWEKASFLVSSGLPGPFLVTPECAKDWWQSSRYPSPLRSEDSSTLWRICSNWATGTFVISLSDFSEHNGCGMTWSAAALAWLGHETPGRSE